MKKVIISFILGGIICSCISVFAVIAYNAKDISFSSELTNATNVEDAINELYSKDDGYEYKILECGSKDTSYTLQSYNTNFMSCVDSDNTENVVAYYPLLYYSYSAGPCPMYYDLDKSNNTYNLKIHADGTCSGRVYIAQLRVLIIYTK